MRNLFCVSLFLFGIVAAASPVRANECKPLQLLTSVQMSPITGDPRVSIPVSINGTTENLLIDSGAPIATLSDVAAKSLGLESSPSRIADLGNGGRSDREYKIETFDIGNQRIKNFVLQENPGALLDGFPVGLFSLDLLRKYEVDLDFGASRLNLFSQDHCAGRVTYWHERPLAIVPFTTSQGHLYIPVVVDGHPLNALIDTGSVETWMSSVPASFTLNLSLGSADTPQIALIPHRTVYGRVPTPPDEKIYSHTFGSLNFDGVTVTNLKMKIYTDTSFGHGYSNVIPIKMPEVIIGMNVLRHLHVYIAYGENKLYITPAGSGESALFQKTLPIHAGQSAPTP
jgi:predicted aspartyl protease